MTIDTPVADSVGYASLQAMRVAHRELLARFESSHESAESVDEVLGFLDRGRRTGAILEEDRERSAGQNILDYWVATLYRLRVVPPVALLAPFSPRETSPLIDARSPYPGLVPFEEEDRHFFYGREAVVHELCEQLASQPCLVITGPSGCGKSSLVRAGVLPALREGTLIAGSAAWRYLQPLVPGDTPLEALAQLLARELPDPAPSVASLVSELRTDPRYLAHVLRPLGEACLVVDQIEAVLPAEGVAIQPDQHAFLRNLAALADEQECACRLLVVCAEDALTALTDAIAPMSTLVRDGPFGDRSRFPVPDFGTRELRDAILEPARQIGLRFEGEREEIVGQLVRTLVGIPAVPPVVQFVMNRLWESRDERGFITREDVELLLYDPQRRRLNAGWALAQAGEAAYARASARPATAQAMETLLLRLVAPAPGSGLTLMRISLKGLIRADDDPATVATALELLESHHLLRRIEAEGSQDQHLELVHDALARLWPRLGKWIDEVRVDDARRERLQQCVEAWLDDSKSQERLWNEVQLADLADLAELTPVQAEFVRRSREHVEQLKRQERRRQQIRVGGLAAIAVLSLTVAALAVVVLQYVRQEEKLQVARRLVSDSRTVAVDTPDLGLLLSLAAMRADSSPASRVGLLSALERNAGLSRVLLAPGRVSAVGVSGDGSMVAAANEGSVSLWDGPSFSPTAPILHVPTADPAPSDITLLRFSPDRTRLAASFTDNTVLVWDTASGRVLPPLVHGAAVVSLAFGSEDLLTTASLDGHVTTWDVSQGTTTSGVLLDTAGVPATITSGSTLSSDGSMLAVPDCAPLDDQSALGETCALGVVRVWNAASGSLAWEQTGHDDAVVSVAFSPDGTRVISGGADGSVIVWDNAQQPGTVLHRFAGHRNPVTSLAVSPDARLLASGDCAPVPDTTPLRDVGHNCTSGEIRVWTLDGYAPIGPVQTQTGGVLNLAFLPNSALLATARASTLLLWDTTLLSPSAPVVPLNARASIGSAVVVPLGNGGFAAGGCLSGSGNAARCARGGLRLLDSSGTPLSVQPPSVGIGQIVALATSPDGARLASGGQDGGVLLWDLQSIGEPTRLWPEDTTGGRPQNVLALAFSPRGQLAANGNDGDVLTWDLEDDNRSTVLHGSSRAPVTALAFSPTEDKLAAGARDGTVALWTSAADAKPSTLGALNGKVNAVAFSPDGSVVAAASDDQTVTLWDVSTHLQIGTPLRSGPVQRLIIDNEGLHVTSPDGEMTTLWDIDLTTPGALETRACQIAHRNLRDDEWTSIDAPVSNAALCPSWPTRVAPSTD
jgi:WD40 repeat protein